MPVQNIYWWPISDFFATNTSSSWSLDGDIPAQTVYASAAISFIGGSRAGAFAFCGVSFYMVQESLPGGVKFLVPRLPSTTNNGVSPGIFDDNVVTVSFAYGAADSSADCHFQIFGWG